jgi:hypothetical protein
MLRASLVIIGLTIAATPAWAIDYGDAMCTQMKQAEAACQHEMIAAHAGACPKSAADLTETYNGYAAKTSGPLKMELQRAYRLWLVQIGDLPPKSDETQAQYVARRNAEDQGLDAECSQLRKLGEQGM